MSKLQPAFLTCHKWRKGLHICAKGHHIRWKVNSQWIQPRNIENRKVSCVKLPALWDFGTALGPQCSSFNRLLQLRGCRCRQWLPQPEFMPKRRCKDRGWGSALVQSSNVSVSCIVSGCFVQSIHLRASLGPWTSWTLDSLECISNAKLRRFKLFVTQNKTQNWQLISQQSVENT